MENSLVFFKSEVSPVPIEEIAKKIIKEGREKSIKICKDYKSQIQDELSLSYRTQEENIAFIKEELQKVELPSALKKSYRNGAVRKKEIIQGINAALDAKDGERRIYEMHYNSQVGINADTFAKIKKEKYLLEIFESLKNEPSLGEKIKWLGTVSEFGLLIYELANSGYIEIADHTRNRNSKSRLRTARLLYKAFHISDVSRKGETTVGTIYNEIGKPSISNKEAGFFKITRTNRK